MSWALKSTLLCTTLIRSLSRNLASHRLFSQALPKMSSLYVKNLNEDERLQINLDLKVGDAVTTFSLNRMKNEESRIALERLRASLDKKNKKKTKKKKKSSEAQAEEDSLEEENHIPIKILHNGEPIALSMANDKAWINGAVLRVGEENISVVYNPPSIKLEKLCPTIMKGFPLFPEVELEFCDINSCEFHWKSVEKKHVDAIKQRTKNGQFDFSETSVSLSYTPTLDDLDKHILLMCVPKIGDRTGKIQAMVSESAVLPGPDPCPFEKRQNLTQHRSNTGEFRVITYNILAKIYTKTEQAKTELFVHCPEYAMDINYRKQLLLKEIVGYQADLICLQEVDKSVFSTHLTPGLNLQGYQGFFRPKKGGVSEGCATFVHKDKFTVVNQLDITLSDYLANDESCKDLWEKICQVKALKEKLEQRSSILQVTVVESVEKPGQFVCVANTHLFYHPHACNIRLIHAATALRYLQAVCNAYTQEGKSIGMVFCGDFNSSPDVGVRQLMTSQFVPHDSADFLSGGDEEALRDVELSHPLNIVSACGFPDFTHYGYAIQCTLDYIYVETSNLEVLSSLPMLELADVQAYTYLPNPLIPSDHLALVSDLRFKS